MKKLLALAFFALIGCVNLPSDAAAQNVTCTTRPNADSSNACASTAFVHNVAGGGAGGITANTTPTTGFTANQFVFSDGTKAQAGTFGLTFGLSGSTLNIANNVALPGSPTTTTQSGSDNSTKIATTAQVQAAIAAAASYQVNVVTYGASTGATDNTSAFQAAADAVSASGTKGGCVFVPQGTWNLAGTVTLNTGVGICGAGWSKPDTAGIGTVLRGTGSNQTTDC